MKMHQRSIPPEFVFRTLPCGCNPPFQLCDYARALLDAEFAYRDAGNLAACRETALDYDAHIAPALAHIQEVLDAITA
jgi:hypothetical protein